MSKLGWLVLLALVVPSAALAQAPVDLLHAVGTDVAVSSVYRSQRVQVDRLVDGDLATAWNSRTGDLVGAWIEVRIPAAAHVTSIGITPGFTHTTAERDLFTSNHRVSRVHVTRDGAEVGTYPLDTSAPVLVTIPVTGPGGVYRIEVAEVLQGSRPDWRETCVSELRVFGTAPSMTPDARLPRTAIGTLPDAQIAAADPVALERTQRRDVAWLATAWTDAQRQYDYLHECTGCGDESADDYREFGQALDAMMLRIATLVAPIDPVRADALRIAAGRSFAWSRWEDREVALDLALERIAEGLTAVGTFLGNDEARCRSSRTIAGMRLRQIASAAHFAVYGLEFGEEGLSHAEAHTIEGEGPVFEAAIEEWSRNSRGVATRMTRHAVPTDARAAADWPAFLAELAIAQTACGWAAP